MRPAVQPPVLQPMHPAAQPVQNIPAPHEAVPEEMPVPAAAPAPRREPVIPVTSVEPLQAAGASSALGGAGWEQLVSACCGCRGCGLAVTRRNVVIEDGFRQAPLMFIGEGPGADEDAQGVPFVGRAGRLLTDMIKAMGRDRTSQDPAKAVYIANIVKCRPPENRNPAQQEAAACLGYLQRQIELVSPRVIVLLGAVPLMYLMGKRGIMANRGRWMEYNGIPVMPTFHPAYLLRFEKYEEEYRRNKLLVWRDLQEVMKRLG